MMSVALAAVGAYFVISSLGYAVSTAIAVLEQTSNEPHVHGERVLMRFSYLLHPLIMGGLGIALWKHSKRIAGPLHDEGSATAWSTASIDALHATALSVLGATYVASGAAELCRTILSVQFEPWKPYMAQWPTTFKAASDVLIGGALAYWSRTLVQLWHRFSHRPQGADGSSP